MLHLLSMLRSPILQPLKPMLGKLCLSLLWQRIVCPMHSKQSLLGFMSLSGGKQLKLVIVRV